MAYEMSRVFFNVTKLQESADVSTVRLCSFKKRVFEHPLSERPVFGTVEFQRWVRCSLCSQEMFTEDGKCMRDPELINRYA